MKNQRGFIFGLQGLAMYLVLGLAIGWGLTIAGSGAAIWYLDGKVEKANKNAQDARDAQVKEEASRKTFEAAAAACSAGVDEIKAAAEKKIKEHQAGQAKSQQATTTALNTIQSILTSQRPAGLDECQAMKKELDDEIDRRRPRN